MKILVVCGQGLGSSFMLELNIKKVLESIGHSEIEVEHTDLSSAKGMKADIYVATKDLASQLAGCNGEIVPLNNIIDKEHIKTELVKKLTEMNYM